MFLSKKEKHMQEVKLYHPTSLVGISLNPRYNMLIL